MSGAPAYPMGVGTTRDGTRAIPPVAISLVATLPVTVSHSRISSGLCLNHHMADAFLPHIGEMRDAARFSADSGLSSRSRAGRHARQTIHTAGIPHPISLDHWNSAIFIISRRHHTAHHFTIKRLTQQRWQPRHRHQDTQRARTYHDSSETFVVKEKTLKFLLQHRET